jgi:hypothetical protein
MPVLRNIKNQDMYDLVTDGLPREQALNVLIAYQSYRSDKSSSLSWTNAWFCPTASPIVLKDKLSMDPWIGHLMCCGSGREPFFSKVVALLNYVDNYVKDCYAWTMWDMYDWGSYADRVWDACDMLVRFPV